MMAYIGFVARLLLALVFGAAAVGKSRNPPAFKRTVRRIGIANDIVSVVAWLIITSEAIFGGLFFLGIFPFFAIIASLLLLLVFIVVSIIAMNRHQKIPCTCFGQSESPLGYQTIVRAMLLVIPIAAYYISTFTVHFTWWPLTFDTTISLLSLVIAIILLTNWLLTVRSIVTLIHSHKPNDGERVLQNV